MSTALATLKQQIIANLQAAKDKLPSPTSSTIRITRDKQFQFPDGVVSTGPFDAVILDWRFLNAWYSKPFKSGEPVSPDCWAQGDDATALIPNPGSAKVQHTDCEGCPKNQWGSSPTGGKACKNVIKLALVPPDAIETTKPLILKTSPTATGLVAKYLRTLINGGVHPMQITTTFGFDPVKEYPTVRVQKGEEHTNLEVIAALAGKATEILELDFSQFDN